MKKLSFLLLLISLYSCSVQKRRYSNGYYVNWNSKKTELKKSDANEAKVAVKKNKSKENALEVYTITPSSELSASTHQNATAPVLKKRIFLTPSGEDSCDVLIFKDGSEVRAKIQEVGITEIKYKRCGNLDGPMHISRKNEIFMIKYANGTKEVIRTESPNPPPAVSQTYSNPQSKSYSNRQNRKVHPLAVASLITGAGSAIAGYILLLLAFDLAFPIILFIIPCFLGITAFVTGQIAFKDIRSHPDEWKGKGLAGPGSVIGIVIGIISFMVLFIAAAFGEL